MKARAKQDVKVLMEDDRLSDFRKGNEYRCMYIGENIILIDEQHMGYKTDMGASCEISVADFPWRAEETLQALVS